MNLNRIPTVQLLEQLRWVIPLAISLVGIAYVLIKEIVGEGRLFYSAEIVSTILVLCVIGPAFAWYTLSKAAGTARAEAETRAELEKMNRELAALNAINGIASTSIDQKTLFESSLGKMVEILDLEAAEIRLVDDGHLVIKSHYGVSDEFLSQERILPLGECLCGLCAQQGQILSEKDLPGNPALVNSACAKEGFASALCLPMEAKGRIIGMIHIAGREKDAFPPDRQRILTALSQRIALAVENARLYEQLNRHAVHFETASLVGQRITAVMNIDLLLTEVVRDIKENFGYYHALLLLVDESAGEVVLRAASGASAEKLRERPLRLKIGREGITGWVAYTGQTLLCRDVTHEPRYRASELVPDTKSELAVPLRVGKRVIGVLDVQSDRLNGFDKEDITVLQILGNQLGIAIENARLFAETKSRYEALMALHEISLDVISQLDRAKLLEDLLRRGVTLWGARGGHFAFYDPRKAEIQIAASYHLPWDLKNAILRVDEGVIGRVIRSGEPMIANDYQNWSGRIEAYAGGEISAVMCAPLKWQEQVFGGIVILHDSKQRTFDSHDLWLLTLFAGLASIAIKNAELHSQLMEFNQGLEQMVAERTAELSLAKEAIEQQTVKLRSALAKTLHLQEEERARIARDMHDGVMQLISAQRYELKAAKVAIESKSESVGIEKLNRMREVLGQMEAELRRAIYDLHPPALDAADLVPALHNYTRTFGEVFGILSEVNVAGIPYRLPDATQIAVFRIIEEALNNVAAHARANTTLVHLQFEKDQLTVQVRDNGCGFDFTDRSSLPSVNHLGLVSMQERVRSLDGRLELQSSPGAGTCLTFSVPVGRDEE